ncbi:acetylornithine transaminase [Nigerium massiliense]|uniref:acetylornithine transaminase n=1 Tax=Nigerium massiliense TaxID=1522317 RepID=UPI00058EF4F4|nr:acetylornithine transaminase [Nigerium massiliense]
MTASADYLARYGASFINTFGTPKLVLDRGEGVYVYDVDGRRYLDLLGGIAVNSLGYAHPDLVAAIADQAGKLMHTSNFFTTVPQIELGERLGALVKGSADVETRVFLANSGSEANEAGFKIARRTGRTRMVAAEGSFHGRTMGSLALTHKAAYREPFDPLPGDVTFVPYGDADALAAAVDDTVAAVVLEPIQGENGVVEPPQGYLSAAREITAKAGALLWLDEVQSGMGRTGEWFAHHAEGVTPDLVTSAKGLGGGFPIGACVALGEAGTLLTPGQHGTTFGGNPLAARVALTVMDVIERDGLLRHAAQVGDWLADELATVPGVSAVRGRGLLRGVVLAEEIAPDVQQRAQDAGFIVNAPRPSVIRLAPPLTITAEELEPFVAAFAGLVEGGR